jgi:ABC-2 type transport system ATP-binding protein
MTASSTSPSPPLAAPGSMPVVAINRLSRVFQGTTVLADLDLTIHPGEVHALIGPNGAGKTTLLRIVAGLLAPTTGEVRVMGQSATDPHTRSLIGWVPAGDRTFYLRISGRENLLFFARLHGLNGGRAKRRIDELLKAVDLADAAHRPSGQYSQGMLKRLGIARALLTEPRLLLFDEATHDLDLDGAEAVRRMVRRMAEDGAGVMWATQRLEELPGLADTVSVIGGGGLRFQGALERLLAEATVRTFVVKTESSPTDTALEAVRTRLGGRSMVERLEGPGAPRLRVGLGEGDRLGTVIALLEAVGVRVVSCTEQEAEIRLAFKSVTERP